MIENESKKKKLLTVHVLSREKGQKLFRASINLFGLVENVEKYSGFEDAS